MLKKKVCLVGVLHDSLCGRLSIATEVLVKMQGCCMNKGSLSLHCMSVAVLDIDRISNKLNTAH